MVKFEIYDDKSGEHRFRLRGADGGVLLSSEGYKQAASARSGIESVRANAPEDGRYERKVAANGKPMFNLKAGNHQIIGTSPTFADEAECERAIAEVKAGAPTAEVVAD